MSEKEITSYTTKEILSKWARLAKFIMHYDALEWDDARKKALELIKDREKAVSYIESKRNSNPLPSNSSPTDYSGKLNFDFKRRTSGDSIFHQNYKRLLKIAPGLEEKLLNDQEVYGKSKVPGMMDFNLEWLYTEEEGVFHMAMSHYYIQNGDMVADPDMRILVNVNEQFVRVLAYQDAFGYQEVFEDMFDRNKINLKLSKSLNSFLKTWLINLNNQQHRIVWKHEEEETYLPTLNLVRDSPRIDSKTEEKSKPNIDNKNQSKKKKTKELRTLYEDTYKKLLRIFPDLIRRLKNEQTIGNMTNQSKNSYEITTALPKNKSTLRFAIQENDEKKTTAIIAVNLRNKRAWLSFADQGFVDVKSSYDEDNHKLLSDMTDYANTAFNSWLYLIETDNYKVRWKEKESDKKETKELKVLGYRDQAKKVKTLFVDIYKSLEYLLPDLTQRLKKDEVDGILSAKRGISYDLIPSIPLNTTTYRFGINENKDSGISLIISVNHRNKRAWLNYADPDFVDEHIYIHDGTDLFKEEVEKANRLFLDWINNLNDKNYKVNWNEKVELAPNSPQIEGHVKLTNFHEKEGIKQKHIDWINEHKKGLVLVKRRDMINNTKSIEADQERIAMKAGKRLSRTGVVYYEGRSNRVDMTDNGL